MNRSNNKPRRRVARRSRKGIAAVECAIVLPILMLLLLGAIDIGQSFDVWNKIENASREGARLAARNGSTSNSDVTTRVTTFLDGAFPSVSSSDLSQGTTITILDQNGGTVTNLASIPTGDPIQVQVSVNFTTVRWLRGMMVFGDRDISTTTRMRRE